MSGGRDRDVSPQRRAADLSAALFTSCGLLVAVLPLVTPYRPGESPTAQLAVGLVAFALGIVIWRLPWERWPESSTWWLVPLAFAVIAPYNLASRNPFTYSLFFMIVFVWIGLVHPRWTAVRSAPLLLAAYLLPLLVPIAERGLYLSAVVYVVPICVITGEAVAWVSDQRRRAEANQRTSEARLDALVRHANEFVVVSDATGNTTFVSSAFERVLGRRAETIVGQPHRELIHPEDEDRLVDAFRTARADVEAPRPIEVRLQHADGSWRWIECTLANLFDDPDVGGMIINGRDITERRAAEQALRESESRFKALLENSSDMVSVIDATGTLSFHYPPWVLGYTEGENLGRSLTDFIHPEDVDRVAAHIARYLDRPGVTEPIECRVRRADGSWRWFEAIGNNLFDDPVIAGIVINSRDVTERKQAELQLEHQALHDSVTDLPNRALLIDRLDLALSRMARHDSRTAVLFLDIDNFKVVNDSLGHAVGDEVLVEVARRLRSVVRQPDTAARFGGDEFVVLCEDVVDPGAPADVAQRLHQVMAEPFELDGRKLPLTVSIGVTMGAGPDCSPDELIRDADAAMYQAKAAGRARTRIFDDDMRDAAVERLETETDLRQALGRDEFVVYYQAEVDLASGAYVGAEALVRWQHPGRGLLGPGEFIPLAEQTGLVIPLGAWILGEACTTAYRWPASPDGLPLRVAVNLSARQLADPDLPAAVEAALGSSGLDPNRLCVEITESMVMQDPVAASQSLSTIKAMGPSVAIDDFGTGYSSLSYLQRFPVDKLKIDRSFVAVLETEEGSALVRSVIHLAANLGLDLVAEGVETAAQAERLVEMGCELAQGFYFARPVPDDEYRAQLDSSPSMRMALPRTTL